MKKKSASVFVVTMLILAVVTIFTQQLMKNSFIGVYYTQTVVGQAQAKQLAWGGLQVAYAELADELPDKNQAQLPGQKHDAHQPVKKWLMRVLPHMNRWRTYTFEKKTDGFDATLQLCIVSEEGKININQAFDFSKARFKKEVEEMLKNVVIPKKLSQGVLLKNLTDFFKKRRRKLDDITQLVGVSGLEGIDVFYKPPSEPAKKNQKPQPNTTVALQDLFTVWTSPGKVEPLLLSDSLCALLGVRRPRHNDAVKIKDKFKQVIEQFNPQWGTNWESNWQFMQILYDQKPAYLKSLAPLLSQQFEPRIYSVLSCATVGRVKQSLLAVIEKRKKEKNLSPDEQQQEKADKEKTKKKDLPFSIKRVYWL